MTLKFRRSRNGGVYVYKLRKKLSYLLAERQDRRPRDPNNRFLIAAKRDANGSLYPRERAVYNYASLAIAMDMTAPALAHAARERRPLQEHSFRALCEIFALEGALVESLGNDEPEDFIAACRKQDSGLPRSSVA